jgi:hypothetical protein
MILSTHALVGAAIGACLSSNPALAGVCGFASHFLLDAIPHWDYPIRSASLTPQSGAPIRLDRALLLDLLTFGIDAIIGLAAGMLLFGSTGNRSAVFVGAVAAMLPDPLQLIPARYAYEPLRTVQRFHHKIHSKVKIAALPLGVSSQLILAIVVAVLTKAAT